MSWRDLPMTEKQKEAIFNIRYALGLSGKNLNAMPETRGAASDEIKRLKSIVLNNLSVGGSINPRRSVYANDGDWGVDHNGD